jgi:hypothetical protein
MTEGGPAASQLENSRPALAMTRGKSASWLRLVYWCTGYRDVDLNHKMLEGGPALVKANDLAPALTLAGTSHQGLTASVAAH